MNAPLYEDRPRVTVPLFHVDFQATGRTQLTDDIWLAELDVPEAERVRLYHSSSGRMLPAPRFRLEIFMDADLWTEDDAAEALLNQALRLLACATNICPVWLSIPIDRISIESGRWHRSSYVASTGGRGVVGLSGRQSAVTSFFGYELGDPDDHWRISAEQIYRWSAILRHWPQPGREKRIDIALEYAVQGILNLLTAEHPAVLAASISYEALFGERSELSHRMAQRVAHLLTAGRGGADVYRSARLWYETRSRLVHEGQRAADEVVADFLTHLRAAIPAMLRLIQECNGHKRALEVLDEACFGEPEALQTLAADPVDAWWRFPVGPVNGLTPRSATQSRRW